MNHQYLESAEFYQRRYYNFASRIILPTVLLCFGLLGFAILATKEITISSLATVEPIKILSQIQSTSNQTILENHLEENKLVQKDQILIKYQATDGHVKYQLLKSQKETLTDQKAQLKLLEASVENGQSQFTKPDPYGYYQLFQDYLSQRQTLQGQIEQQNSSIAAQNTASTNQQAAIGRQISEITDKINELEHLKVTIQSDLTPDSSVSQQPAYQIYQAQVAALPADVDPTSKTKLQQQFLAQIDSQIEQLRTAQASANVQYAGTGSQQAYASTLDSQLASLKHQTLNKVAQEATSLDQQLRDSQSNLDLQTNLNQKDTIVAQEDGIIHLNPETADAKLIPEGTLIAQLYPVLTKTKQIKLTSYVSSKDVSRIKKGDPIRFTTQNDSEKTISITSTVTSIATTTTKTPQGNFFKVEAKTQLTPKEAKELRYGLEGRVVLITGQKSYFNYYKDQFFNR